MVTPGNDDDDDGGTKGQEDTIKDYQARSTYTHVRKINLVLTSEHLSSIYLSIYSVQTFKVCFPILNYTHMNFLEFDFYFLLLKFELQFCFELIWNSKSILSSEWMSCAS